jgi:hypothetical protein
MSTIVGWGLGPKSGRGFDGFSVVNTDIKWLLMILAFPFASLQAMSSPFRGALLTNPYVCSI